MYLPRHFVNEDEAGDPAAALAFFEDNPTEEYLDEICPEQARIQRFLDGEEDPVEVETHWAE